MAPINFRGHLDVRHRTVDPDKRRAELLALPGFGDTFSDHMVTVRWTAELGWHDARVGPLAAFARHPALDLQLLCDVGHGYALVDHAEHGRRWPCPGR
jgi:hypothetical protein